MDRDSKEDDTMWRVEAKESIEKSLKNVIKKDTIDDETYKHIEGVIEWMNYLNDGWDKCFLILMGSVGNGKTSLMEALIDYMSPDYDASHPVKIRKAKDLAKAAIKGEDYNPYCTVLAIDDLGEEPKEVMCFGNVVTPIIDIIEDRYEWKRITIITTNLDEAGIREKYGVRVADRLKEISIVVPFTNSSYR